MKKSKLIFLPVLLITFLVSAAVCFGEAVTPKWVTQDYTTKVEAPKGFVDGTSSAPMANFCKVADGILVFNTMADPAAGPTYKLSIAAAPVGFKFTVVVRAKADSENGMDFDFRTGVRERVKLLATGLELSTSANKTDKVKTTEWHTYFMTFEMISDAGVTKLSTKIYVDGDNTPIVQGLSITADSAGYFRFGDGSSSAGYAGSIDWIIWAFDSAASPSQVNMPEGFKLK